MIIKGGILIDPIDKTSKRVDIRYKDGKIVEIADDIKLDGTVTAIDAKNLYIAPGLVGTRVHLREPGFTYKETISTGVKAAIAGGYTTIVATSDTEPCIDEVDKLKDIYDKYEKEDILVFSAATITRRMDGETINNFKELRDNGAVYFCDDGMVIRNDMVLRQAMLDAKDANVPIAIHNEDLDQIDVSGISDGKFADSNLIKGTPVSAETSMLARDIELARETGARVVIQNISSKESVDLIRQAKAAGVDLIVEISPEYFSLTENALPIHGTNAKVIPPLRTEEDRLAIIEGLKDGTIDIISPNHSPHDDIDKSYDITTAPSGMIGLEIALSLAITYLVRPGHLSIEDVITKMTLNPARVYGIKAGTVEIGEYADFVIFDPEEEVVYEEFNSKSENTPFKSLPLWGKIVSTIDDGEIL